jgi:hypothetical protein
MRSPDPASNLRDGQTLPAQLGHAAAVLFVTGASAESFWWHGS